MSFYIFLPRTFLKGTTILYSSESTGRGRVVSEPEDALSERVCEPADAFDDRPVSESLSNKLSMVKRLRALAPRGAGSTKYRTTWRDPSVSVKTSFGSSLSARGVAGGVSSSAEGHLHVRIRDGPSPRPYRANA